MIISRFFVKFFLCSVLAFYAGIASAQTLRELPNDDGVMMSMGLLAANSGLSAAKERMATNIMKKYGLKYSGSNITYNEEKDRLILQGTFSDARSPSTFNKTVCSRLVEEVRGSVQRALNNQEAVNAFLGTYYIMAGGAHKVNVEALKAKIKERMIITSNVSMVSSLKNAVCSGTVDGTAVYYKAQ